MKTPIPTEIELKLALPPEGPAALRRHPLLSDLPPLRQGLTNIYYDTPQGALAQARMAVRLRKIDDQVLQTVKTAGYGGSGLSQRQEWEWPIPSPTLDTQGLADLPPFHGELRTLIETLEPQLNTDFIRNSWLLEWQASQIEIALDEGEIRSSGQCAIIREVELELKRGEPDALWSLAQALAEHVPLRPSDSSKAARGNALAVQDWPLPEASSPVQWMQRATLALDAYHDSHHAEHLTAARAALATLAADSALSDQARHDVEIMRDTLKGSGQPSLAYGQAALAFAHRMAYQTALR